MFNVTQAGFISCVNNWSRFCHCLTIAILLKSWQYQWITKKNATKRFFFMLCHDSILGKQMWWNGTPSSYFLGATLLCKQLFLSITYSINWVPHERILYYATNFWEWYTTKAIYSCSSVVIYPCRIPSHLSRSFKCFLSTFTCTSLAIARILRAQQMPFDPVVRECRVQFRSVNFTRKTNEQTILVVESMKTCSTIFKYLVKLKKKRIRCNISVLV